MAWMPNEVRESKLRFCPQLFGLGFGLLDLGFGAPMCRRSARFNIVLDTDEFPCGVMPKGK